MKIDFKNGLFFISSGGLIREARGELLLKADGFQLRGSGISWRKKGKRSRGEHAGLQIIVDCDDQTIGIEFQNSRDAGIYIAEAAIVFSPEDISPELEALNFLQLMNSRDMGEGSGIKQVGRATPWSRGGDTSKMFTVFSRKEKHACLLIGSLGKGDGFIDIEPVHSSPTLEEAFGFRIISEIKAELAPGKKFRTGGILFLSGTKGLSLLEKYGKALKKTFKPAIRPAVAGWNSWDYYAGSVSMDDIKKNIASAKKNLGYKIRYIVIDDGWQRQWGVWKENWKFSEGITHFCSAAKTAGYVPGIWTAPFLADINSPLYRKHPEYFAKTSDGQIALCISGRMGVLDVTRNDVADHLETTFAALRRCGIAYFKIDFLNMALMADLFHDKSVGRAEIVRKGISAIRRGIGRDSYLLACGAPLESAAGDSDAVRVTGDIHNLWSHVITNARGCSARYWMHGKLWRNDPDFLIARSGETSNDKLLNRSYIQKPYSRQDYWKSGREMRLNEIKTYALFTFLSGGDLILGDAIHRLNSRGINILKRILEKPLKEPAVPLDLFNREEQIPSIFMARENKKIFIGVFNWNDCEQEFKVDLENIRPRANRILDFWSGKKISWKRACNFSLPARSSAGFIMDI